MRVELSIRWWLLCDPWHPSKPLTLEVAGYCKALARIGSSFGSAASMEKGSFAAITRKNALSFNRQFQAH